MSDQFPISRESYDQFIEDLLERTPESYDDDDDAEAIAISYVRDLEAAVKWLLDMTLVAQRPDEDHDVRTVTLDWRPCPPELRKLVQHYMDTTHGDPDA